METGEGQIQIRQSALAGRSELKAYTWHKKRVRGGWPTAPKMTIRDSLEGLERHMSSESSLHGTSGDHFLSSPSGVARRDPVASRRGMADALHACSGGGSCNGGDD